MDEVGVGITVNGRQAGMYSYGTVTKLFVVGGNSPKEFKPVDESTTNASAGSTERCISSIGQVQLTLKRKSQTSVKFLASNSWNILFLPFGIAQNGM
jgi:hypothetical protein